MSFHDLIQPLNEMKQYEAGVSESAGHTAALVASHSLPLCNERMNQGAGRKARKNVKWVKTRRKNKRRRKEKTVGVVKNSING